VESKQRDGELAGRLHAKFDYMQKAVGDARPFGISLDAQILATHRFYTEAVPNNE
jgi:hypothetical protein